MKQKKIIRLFTEHKIPALFLTILLFVFLAILYKLLLKKPQYVYVRVKVSQGLWWVNTENPGIWLVNGIHTGDEQVDLTGRPVAEIIEKRYYPVNGGSQYSIYLTVKLRANISNQITFNRMAIGIGSPIDFSFPTTQFSGTITELSTNPIKEKYVVKTITLTKKGAFPWDYDSIKVGDSFFDGKDTVIKILNKNFADTVTLIPDMSGNYNASIEDARKYITLIVKMKLEEKSGQYFLGDEQQIRVNKGISFSTQSYDYNDYFVSNMN